MFLPVGTDETRPRRSFPIVTLALVAVNVAVFGYELVVLVNGGEEALNSFIQAFGAVPREIMTGRDLGLGGPAWSTARSSPPCSSTPACSTSPGNMLYLAAFGDNVEDRLGHVGLLHLLPR